MKRILYLMLLLFCFAGCKKEDAKKRIAATQVSFENKSLSSITLKYNGQEYPVGIKIGTIYGDRRVEIFSIDGKPLIDTVLNITGKMIYYVYQVDPNIAPVLITELPALPPGPEDPLENVTPAPEGFMKIKIKHDLAPLGFEKIDVEVLSNFNSADNYELYTTIPNVTTTLSSDFVTIQRPVREGAMLQNFKFRFINSITKAPALSGNGQAYTTYNATLGRSVYNAYLLGFSFFESGDPNDFEHNGVFYEIDADVIGK